MLTTLRTGALALTSAQYKFDTATKTLTIKLTASAPHKLYGTNLKIAITGADEINIFKKDGSMVADYFNATFEFSRTSNTTLEYSEVIDRGVEDTAGAFVSLGDVAVKATGEIEITDYAALVSGTDDTITIGATVFTAQAGAATPGDATFQAATGDNETAASLAAQINAHETAGALVLAEADGAVVTLTAITAGVGGNAIALAYTDNDTNAGATVSGSFLENGEDGVESEIENDVVEVRSGRYSLFLLDTPDSDFSGAEISITSLNLQNSGVDGIESVFDEDIDKQELVFPYSTRISIKNDDSGTTNIPIVING